MSGEGRPQLPAADLPLPGGRDGATVRLHLFSGGEVHAPPMYFARPEGPLGSLIGWGGLLAPRSRWTWAPVPAFVVEHPGAGPVLIDTALHPTMVDDPRDSFGRLGAAFTRTRVEPEQVLKRQLQQREIPPAEIETVVMTHLHVDHASGISEFPSATFLVDTREWAAAWGPRPALRGYHRPQFDHPFKWRSFDHEASYVEPFAGFAHTIDLFGDGSVRLLSTPGHTPGHHSLLLRLAGRDALLTVDAAYLRRSVDHELTPLITADESDYRSSLKTLHELVESSPDMLVVPGHDAEVWPTLEPVYE
ncbi:MAG TPA: N-acyl homoserine lactonase family protein [Solirubrobacteraceae bacterium]|nr:N-acyl homoserine lactonase family protein [Solirubrobacteraceae bacterium]